MSETRMPEGPSSPEEGAEEVFERLGVRDEMRLELDDFAGPLDLLLYLVRKQEVEIEQLSLARLTEQFLAFLDGLDELDLERAGDYLVMAAQLLALKARSLLPGVDEDSAPQPVALLDREGLVQELLAYRTLREQSRLLAELEQIAARRHARSEPRTLRELPPRNVDLWDLVTAFNRLQEQLAARPGEAVFETDDTPLAVYVERIRDRLAAAPAGLAFSALFPPGAGRSQLIATFLALLELIRLGEARAEQGGPFGEIRLQRAEPPSSRPEEGER